MGQRDGRGVQGVSGGDCCVRRPVSAVIPVRRAMGAGRTLRVPICVGAGGQGGGCAERPGDGEGSWGASGGGRGEGCPSGRRPREMVKGETPTYRSLPFHRSPVLGSARDGRRGVRRRRARKGRGVAPTALWVRGRARGWARGGPLLRGVGFNDRGRVVEDVGLEVAVGLQGALHPGVPLVDPHRSALGELLVGGGGDTGLQPG